MNFHGKKCLITAGPTYEAIDPVRFIGNRSSGRMGIELATAIAHKGVKVVLVLGPSNIKINNSENIRVIRIETADQMYDAVMAEIESCDIGIFAAAVADYKPKYVPTEKIKKTSDETITLELVKTKDILATAAAKKMPNQVIVGFALETTNELENAKAKLLRKNLDMIVLNSLQDQGAGFQHKTNKITILNKYNNLKDFELKNKKEVAEDIIAYIQEKF